MEHLDPFGEHQIRCDDGAGGFMAGREHLEQQFGTREVNGHISHLVEDQQIHPVQIPLKRRQSPLLFRFVQFIDETGDTLEHHPVFLFTCANPCCDRQMGLPRSGIPDHEDILMIFEERERTQQRKSNRERMLPSSPLPGTVRAPFSAYRSRISLPR